jgi:hypothetical protein
MYTVTIGTLTNANGSIITANPASGMEGTEITLTVSPVIHYRLKAGTLKYDTTAINETTLKFYLPAKNVTVSAEFELDPGRLVLNEQKVYYFNGGYTGTKNDSNFVPPEHDEFTLPYMMCIGSKSGEIDLGPVPADVPVTDGQFSKIIDISALQDYIFEFTELDGFTATTGMKCIMIGGFSTDKTISSEVQVLWLMSGEGTPMRPALLLYASKGGTITGKGTNSSLPYQLKQCTWDVIVAEGWNIITLDETTASNGDNYFWLLANES